MPRRAVGTPVKEPLAKGFICACGESHRFPSYVYAHWCADLIFTCPECDRTYNVIRGIACDYNTDLRMPGWSE